MTRFFLMYQDFDASEFDYLTSATPQQFEQQNQTKAPEVTNIERFWTLTGNWGEFGSYRGRGLVRIPYRAGNSGADSCCCNSYPRRWFGSFSPHFDR